MPTGGKKIDKVHWDYTEDKPMVSYKKLVEEMGFKIVPCEGIEGTWHYHYRVGDSPRSLCGARVMASGLTEEQWGFKGHLNERYCAECEGRRAELLGDASEERPLQDETVSSV